jgi:hypothetical protein
MVAEISSRDGRVRRSEHVRSGKILAMTTRMLTRSLRLLMATENSPWVPRKHRLSTVSEGRRVVEEQKGRVGGQLRALTWVQVWAEIGASIGALTGAFIRA